MEHLTWEAVIEDVLNSKIDRIHTAMPGKIVSYNHATQKADIEPQLKTGGSELKIIKSVPVIWPVAYSDLSAGDTVLLIFCEADIGLWRQQNQAGQPLDARRHGLHGAVAIAGLRSASNTLDHVSGSTVLPGDDCRLSEYSAAQSVLRASAWAASIATPGTGFLSALLAWAAVVENALIPGINPPGTPAYQTLAAATTAYANGISGAAPWLSTKVKVP